jgi:hypothetical protein
MNKLQHEYFTRDWNADNRKEARDSGTIEAKNVLISIVFLIRLRRRVGATIN